MAHCCLGLALDLTVVCLWFRLCRTPFLRSTSENRSPTFCSALPVLAHVVLTFKSLIMIRIAMNQRMRIALYRDPVDQREPPSTRTALVSAARRLQPCPINNQQSYWKTPWINNHYRTQPRTHTLHNKTDRKQQRRNKQITERYSLVHLYWPLLTRTVTQL